MKHLARTLLCVVLAAAMVFALGAGAFAASVDNAKHYDTYDAASYAGMREEFRAYLSETDLLTLGAQA